MCRDGHVDNAPRFKETHERAKSIYPGGISYRIRYFEPYPFCSVNANGSRLYDIDGNIF